MNARAIADKYISPSGGAPQLPTTATDQELAWLQKAISRNGYMPTKFRDGDYAPSLEHLRKMSARNLVIGPPWRITQYARDAISLPVVRPVQSASTGSIKPLWEVERDAILSAIRACRFNKTHAADALGITVRTIRNKLREYERNEAALTPKSKAIIRMIPE